MCVRVLFAPRSGAEARKTHKSLACQFGIKHGPLIAIPALEAIEVTDGPLPTPVMQLHDLELEMKLDLSTAIPAGESDKCFLAATLLQKTKKYGHMSKTLTAVLQHLATCVPRKVKEPLRVKVLEWIDKLPEDLDKQARKAASEASKNH